MPILEDEIAELNQEFLRHVGRYEGLLAKYFDPDGEAMADIRAAKLLSVGDRLPVPPALLPARALTRFREHNTAFRAAIEFLFAERFGGSWERLADEMGLQGTERAFIDFGRQPRLTAFGRPDLVINGDAITMVEPNSGSSAGALEDADVLGRLFESAPVIGDFLRRIGARRSDVVASVADVLRARLREAGREIDGLVVVTEFGVDIDEYHCSGFARELRRHGLNAVAHATEELDVDDDRVALYGRTCELIYRLSAEQPDPVYNHAILRPLLDVARAGAVILVDDLADQIAGHKTILAAVSEAVDTNVLPSNIRAALETFVPWSRILADGPADISGERVNLLTWCIANQEDLVLKPGAGYRGRGVTLGCEVEGRVWQQTIEEALASSEPWLVQRLARSAHARVSIARSGGLASEETFVDYSYFAIGDSVPVAALRKHAPFGTPTRRVKRCGIGPAFYV